MATVSFYFQQDKSKDFEGRFPILLRVSDRGNRAYFSTGFFSLPAEFDASVGRYRQGSGVRAFKVYRREADGMQTYTNKLANDTLAQMESEIKAIIKRFEADKVDWTLDQLRDCYRTKRSSATVADYWQRHIDQLRKERRYKSATVAEDALRSFRDYDPKFDRRTFADLNTSYLNKYISSRQEQGNRAGTISIRLRQLRALLNEAIARGVGSKAAYPFGKQGGVKIPSPDYDERAANQRKFIPTEGLRKLNDYRCDNPLDEAARRLFLLLFHCRGLNYRDAAELRRQDITEATIGDETVEVISYRRGKTHKRISFAITPAVREQLDWFAANTRTVGDYLLPIIQKEPAPEHRADYIDQRRKRTNIRLKRICQAIGLPEPQIATIYASRHSYAMFLYQSGASVEVIAAGLAHESVSTTRHYLSQFDAVSLARLADTTL